MKKKILALVLVVVLAITAVTGATLAYFTDTDSATNKFTTTTDGVDIMLIEQERGANGLQDFTQDKKLYPINGSAQTDAKDSYGLTTAENYVDKIVTVKNLKEDAYVRVYFAIPAALEAEKAANNTLHWNLGNKFVASGDKTDGQAASTDYASYMGECVQLTGTTKIDGIDYNVYYMTYKKALTKDEVTGSAFIVGVYLDSSVNRTVDEDGEVVWTDKNGVVNFDLDNGVNIPVYAVGVQAKGFDDADTAINAAFPNYNPWATTAAE